MRRVSERGHTERWYLGGGIDFNSGIRVEDGKQIELAKLIIKAGGLPLGKEGFYGIADEDKFYDQESCLYNGTIVTYSKRNEFFGRLESELPEIKISERMPEEMITILGESEGIVLKVARDLRLPLEKAVNSGKFGRNEVVMVDM